MQKRVIRYTKRVIQKIEYNNVFKWYVSNGYEITENCKDFFVAYNAQAGKQTTIYIK